MKEITLTHFAASTPEGLELANMLFKVFESTLSCGLKVNMSVILDGGEGDMKGAGLRDDIVVFDASIEDDTGSNYKAAGMWACHMEHFLVVSRTWLPLNFQPYHLGGAPGYPGNKDLIFFQNEDLVGWILSQLEKLSPRLPRPQEDRFDVAKDQYYANRVLILNLTDKLLAKSSESKDADRKEKGRAFISYISRLSRSHRDPEPAYGFFVEDLQQHIKQEHGRSDYPVFYFPPGILSSEFMTEHRRWQVLSLIDWQIRASDEFWIFETKDYYNSWWTLAELASLAFISHSGKGSMPAIYSCKPTDKGFVVTRKDLAFIQSLDKASARTFGRFLSHSDPETMGYETVRNMQKLSKRSWLTKWLTYKTIQFFTKATMGGTHLYNQLQDHAEGEYSVMNSFKLFQEMLQSPVYGESFWQDRIVSCTGCSGENKAREQFDFQTWLHNNLPGQYRLSQEEMNQALEAGYWRCQVCGTTFRIIEEPHPHYLWWPVRVGRATGPGGAYIEKIPVYTFGK